MSPQKVHFDPEGAVARVDVLLSYQGAGGGTASYEWLTHFVNVKEHWLVASIDQTVR
jgi:hypothetical protein